MNELTLSTIRALEAECKVDERYTLEHRRTPPGSVDALRYFVIDRETGDEYAARDELAAKRLKAALTRADRTSS